MQVLQVISSVAQVLSPVLYAAFIVVIWFQLRAARDSLREVRQEFLAGGRPVVAVHDEFDHATRTLSIAVENVARGRPRASPSSSPARSRAPTASWSRDCRCSPSG